MLIKIPHRETGFTLIELAIVLVIIGVLAGSFLATLGSRIETTRRAEAEKEMGVIKQALYGYAMSQTPPHLPCPDCRTAAMCPSTPSASLNDGIEDRAGAVCDVGNTPGNIPWKTLGLGSGDPWGNRYTYWVSGWAADVNTTVSPPTGIELTKSPNPSTPGKEPATIKTRVGTAFPDVSDSVVAVIMTQGKDGYGSISIQNILTPAVPTTNVDEKDNLDNNLVFVSRAPTKSGATTAGGEFDDMLVWISEYELKAKMVEAGVLP
jgi:prepilin-type N-terminal cleavage/methylation domain-containing protein